MVFSDVHSHNGSGMQTSLEDIRMEANKFNVITLYILTLRTFVYTGTAIKFLHDFNAVHYMDLFYGSTIQARIS